MMTSPIIPAIIPRSYADLVDQVTPLFSLPELHIDVVDGVFVEAISWPYTVGALPGEALRLLESFSLEVDLMVADQIEAALAWLKAGADQLVFHIEKISTAELAQFAHAHTVTVGVAAHNDTPREVLYEYLAEADYVQVMGIATIGLQGQPFDRRSLDRIADIKVHFPQLPISLDGSVNQETLPDLVTLGLARFIVGSGITQSSDPLAAYYELSKLACSQQG
jgi:pentose-5-phosphate-3-epimerase